MHDLLKAIPETDTEGKALPLLLVGAFNHEAVDLVKELVLRSGLKGKVAMKPMTADFNENPFDLLLMICTTAEDAGIAEANLATLSEEVRSESAFVILSGTALEKQANLEASMAPGHLLKSPVAPGNFLRILMGSITEHNLRIASGKMGFDQPRQSLGELLVKNDIVKPAELEEALKLQKETGKRLGECLLKLGMITDRERTNFLAAQLNAKVANAQQYSSAEMNVVSLIPEHIAKRHQCIALALQGDDLYVAMQDILDLRLLDSLRDITEKHIIPMLGTQDEISQAIERYYRDITTEKDATSLMADLTTDNVEFLKKDDDDEGDAANSEHASAELGIVRLVNMMIGNAVRDKASDIHIEPQDKSLIIRYRIDGELRRIMTPPKKSHQAILTRIKILSNLDIAERRLPQDGRMGVKISGREVDVRVSILPTVFGEKAVLRILDKDAFDRTIGNIGFSTEAMKVFERQIHKPYGMVIVTGPTGSGKSTTLYSAIQSVKDVSRNIITVEDPVEFHIDGVSQVHVRTKVGLTFGTALRSILRQDPDVILIGEIRDQETADIAVKMSLTGHMVFSTLHTNDAVSTITRFVDIGIPPLLLGSCLNLIIAQRLVRRICQHCRKEYIPDPAVLANLHTPLPPGAKFFRGEGCVHCHGNGFSGRIPLFEMLEVTPAIRRLIHQGAPTVDILDVARQNGMQSIFEMGLQRVIEGETTLEQVIAVAIEI